MQISDDLIQHITRKLMKRLEAENMLDVALAEAPARPLLHLVGSLGDLSAPALARLQEKFDIREHKSWDDELPPQAAVLITSLNIQALVRVAEGDEGCTVEGRALLTALLNGQPVAALSGGLVWRRYQATAPKELLARYARCEKTLVSYGLKLVEEDQVAGALLGQVKTEVIQCPPLLLNQVPARRRVWSEVAVMAACPAASGGGQTLRLGPGDVLTPLARDYIAAMTINVVKD